MVQNRQHICLQRTKNCSLFLDKHPYILDQNHFTFIWIEKLVCSILLQNQRKIEQTNVIKRYKRSL